MRYVIVDDDSLPYADFVPTITPYELKIDSIEPQNDKFKSFEIDGERIYLKSTRGGRFKMKLASQTGDMLFVRLTLDPEQSEYLGDRIITINSTKNKLTAKGARYHNQNNVFDYLISSDKTIEELDFWLSDGEYNIIKAEFWSANYRDFSGIKDSLYAFTPDGEQTSGDEIVGVISCESDGYFDLSVPYDKGFTVTVDGKKTEYSMVDTAFVGFPIAKGTHQISKSYRSPGLDIGLGVSLVGILTFILIVIFSNKKAKERD